MCTARTTARGRNEPHRLHLTQLGLRSSTRGPHRTGRRAATAVAGRVPPGRSHQGGRRLCSARCRGRVPRPGPGAGAGAVDGPGLRPRATGAVRPAAGRAGARPLGRRLRAGVRDVLSADADDESLRAALYRATELTGRRQATLARARAGSGGRGHHPRRSPSSRRRAAPARPPSPATWRSASAESIPAGWCWSISTSSSATSHGRSG